MSTISRIPMLTIAALVLAASLTACGSKSSTTSTTIPNSETVFYAHNVMFRNHTTFTAGYNAFGQLGSGGTDLSLRSFFGNLSLYLPFSGAATGGNHTVAFINNSTVRAWGSNALGRLGNSDSTVATHSTAPVPVFRTISGVRHNLSGIKAVAAGAQHSLALRNDDTLWAWGNNDVGQLGAETITTLGLLYSNEPRQVSAAGVIFANISSIAANGKHSLARAGGRVWAWGLNGSGQLGIDPHITGASIIPTVVNVPTSGIAGIAAGAAFNFAVGRDGSLWAWGNNTNGQLGNNSTVSTHLPVQVLTAAGTPLTGIVQAAAGGQHGLAVDAGGTVWAWGYNHFSQLGTGSTKDSLVAVPVSSITNATEVRAFGASSMARAGGAWYVWGDNSYGQLGLGLSKIIIPSKLSGF